MTAPDLPLFCPFCRECFEGIAACPEHELPLVRFERLPVEPELVTDDTVLGLWDPRFSRGWVAICALLTLVAMLLPFLTTEARRGMSGTASALHVARTVAPALWILPASALSALTVLSRRRTIRRMRGARLVFPVSGAFALAALLYTVHHVYVGASLMSERLHEEIAVRLEFGGYLLLLAQLGLGSAGWRLGVGRKPS